MKNKQLIIIPAFILLASCGQKNPVSDLSELREKGKVAEEIGPQRPNTVTNTIIVEKPVEVIREGSTIDQNMVVISPEEGMTFVEGKSSSFKIRTSVQIEKVEMSLTAQGLPEGAQWTKSTTEAGVYILTWKPALYTTGNAAMKVLKVKLVPKIISTGNDAAVEKLKGLVLDKTIDLNLFKNLEGPADLKVASLPSEIEEGKVSPFTVTVTVPGTDSKAPLKPTLNIRYDQIAISAGNNFQELDGSRHVVIDLNKKDPEYLGDAKWKYTLLFDTKNILPQPQLDNSGKVIAAADGTRVRLSFKVTNQANGLSTPEVLAQVKIKYVQTVVTPAPGAQ